MMDRAVIRPVINEIGVRLIACLLGIVFCGLVLSPLLSIALLIWGAAFSGGVVAIFAGAFFFLITTPVVLYLIALS